METVMMIDSLELDDADVRGSSERARRAARRAIVVTHGTDTMVETAAALAAARLDDKTIVLTGAMVPYAFGARMDCSIWAARSRSCRCCRPACTSR